jgi:hypothetical protein
MRELLTALIFLACPLMMIFMMRGMHGGGHGRSHASPKDEPSTAELRKELDELERHHTPW